MVGARAPEQILQLVSYFCGGLDGSSKQKEAPRPPLGLGGGSKGFGAGGVGGRGTGPKDGANFATCVVFLMFLMHTKRRKMIFFEG